MNGWMDRLLNENADGRAQRKSGSRSNSGQGRKINQMRETRCVESRREERPL